MRKICRMMTVLLALALLTAIIVPGAALAETGYTAPQGGTMSFTKYLIMETDANVPNASFAFTAAPGEAIPPTDGRMEVLAGIGTPTIESVSFAVGDPTTAGIPGDPSDTAHKYAQKTVTVSFGEDCAFSRPGIYRYTVTETASENPGVTNDAVSTLTLDVYVTDDGSRTLSVAAYALHTGTEAPSAGTSNTSDDAEADAELSDKTTGFTNTYETANLCFRKQISGNKASYDKYFAFTVTISGAVPGTKYAVDLEKADASISANPNAATTCIPSAVTQPAELTVGADGKLEQVFYLHHDQEITIKGLAIGTEYSIVEDPEEYKSDKTDAAVSGTMADDDVTETFTNTRNGMIPTGVALSLLPGMSLLLTAAVGTVLLKKKNRD